MKCIVIEDDSVARLLIEKYTKKIDFLEIKGSYSNAIEALNALEKDDDVDLIFLDIEMPNMTGVEFMETLNQLPQVIIISAQEKYAIDAIEYNVTDYILKPIRLPRFYKAVEKAHERHKQAANQALKDDGIFIKNTTSSLIRLSYEDILWVEALENYVVVNTFDNKYTIHFTMKAMISKLPAKMFTRIHRSYIVNLSKIDMIEDNEVIIPTSTERKNIPIAKSYKDHLMQNINIITK